MSTVEALLRGTAWETLPDGMERAFAEARARAHAAWPDLAVPDEDFAQSIGAAVADEADPVAATHALNAGDLYLAAGCARGEAEALKAVDVHLAGLRPAIARMGAASHTVDDTLQQIRARLFATGEDRPARIRSYRGTGDLRSWLKVVVVRDALRMVQRESRGPTPSDEVEVLMDPGGDPELQAMHSTYHASFREAFGEALDALSPRDRNVLRYHLVDGLAIDELGAIYRVHRSTAARWLVAVRERLYAGTRRALMQRLSLTPSEFDSVLRLIQSRLDASIAGHLEPAD